MRAEVDQSIRGVSMLRTVLFVISISLVSSCGSKPSLDDQLRLKEKEARLLEAASQDRLIESTAQSVHAVPLIPGDYTWDYRFQAQEHFANLGGKSIKAEVKVDDVVRVPNGIVIAGEPSGLTYPLLFWVRLHGLSQEFAKQLEWNDTVICIGSPSVTAPAGPYLELRALREDEIEVETSAIPLIVDVQCTHGWRKEHP